MDGRDAGLGQQARLPLESAPTTGGQGWVRTSPSDAFQDRNEFFDDVHGPIQLNDLERDVVDTPEFQRLFRIGQLGLVDLVFPTANHTRGVHSIGACFWAKKLVDALNKNRLKYNSLEKGASEDAWPTITKSERVLIGLAALLHDVSHGPFSHDIEKKTHYVYGSGGPPLRVISGYGLYPKHDDLENNAALYVLLHDTQRSVLARVLRHYSRAFAESILNEDAPHLRAFIALARQEWQHQEEWLPALVFHLLAYDKPEKAAVPTLSIKSSFYADGSQDWRLGPADSFHSAWYQPFRHDIIGNTLSADLLEYLHRDCVRLGLGRRPDLKLLQHYVLVPWRPRGAENEEFWKACRYRCAIDLWDHKRGTFRAERLNDIFRLFDLRHEIQEKAVTHRVVHSGVAMLNALGRSLERDLPPLAAAYGLEGSAPTPAIAGDDYFLSALCEKARNRPSSKKLALKLAERRMYRPLMVIPGDRIDDLDLCWKAHETDEIRLRKIAAMVDSSHFEHFFRIASNCIQGLLEHSVEFSQLPQRIRVLAERGGGASGDIRNFHKVLFHTTPYKQLHKDPAILVALKSRPALGSGQEERLVERIDDLADGSARERIGKDLHARIRAGVADLETKNAALWKLYAFLSDGLFCCGPLMALAGPGESVLEHVSEHGECLKRAAAIVVASLQVCAADQCEPNRWAEPCPNLRWHLQSLAHKLEAEGQTLMATAARVSAIRFDQYVHGGGDMRQCRDIRYKYQQTVRGPDEIVRDTVQTAIGDSGHAWHQLAAQICAIVKGNESLGTEDLREIALRLAYGADCSDGVWMLPGELVNGAARQGNVNFGTLAKIFAKSLGLSGDE